MPPSLSARARPGRQLLVGERVVQAEQPLQVLDRGEQGGDARADPLGRGVRGAQLRVALLQRAQFPDQRVELAVGDDRRVEHVVAVLVLGDLHAQLRVTLPCGVDVGHGRHHPSSISSGSSRAASRQCARTASAYPGDTPARPQAGVSTTCAATAARPAPDAAGQPIRRHRSTTRRAVTPGSGSRAPPRSGSIRGRGGDRAGQDPQASLHGLGQAVLLVPPQQAEVETDRLRTHSHDHAERNCRSAAVHEGKGPGRLDHRGEPGLSVGRLRDGQAVEPAGGRHRAREHSGQGRLVELQQHLRTGHAPAHLVHVRRRSLRERLGEVGHGAGVGERGILAAGQLDRGRQRPRPAHLYLQRPPVAVGGLLQRVEIGGQQVTGPAQVAARAGGEAPAGGRGLHRQVDQQRGGPAGQVGAGPPGRELDQVGQVGQLAENDPHRLGRVGAGQGSDPGRAARRPREPASGAGVRTRPRTRHHAGIRHAAELKGSPGQRSGGIPHQAAVRPDRGRTGT